jgi:hypothetical protein
MVIKFKQVFKYDTPDTSTTVIKFKQVFKYDTPDTSISLSEEMLSKTGDSFCCYYVMDDLSEEMLSKTVLFVEGGSGNEFPCQAD